MVLNAVNAEPRVVVDYTGRDPNSPGVSIIAQAMLRLHGWLVPVYAGGDVDPEGQYHGISAAPMQDFRGLANPASTTVAYRDGGWAGIDSAVAAGVTGDPARRIFADRLRRRQL